MTAPPRMATIDDLYRCEGKAELINGRIVETMGSGRRPTRLAFQIARFLDDYARMRGVGEAYPDGMGFTVPILPSGRQSFMPDAAYFTGPFGPNDMRFNEGPPDFAVEVRSENDYGNAAEEEMADKREDYFQAGTLVVWDVDPLAYTITCYRHHQPSVTFQRGQTADAEPAVPGWRIAVDEVFS
jgi:Uma2 family endonuclease